MFSWFWGEKKEGSLAGGARETSSLSTDINNALETVDGLIVKRIQLLQKAHNALKDAKEHKKNGDNAKALSCMKQKQMYENQANVYEGMIANMERTSMALDSTATSAQVAKTMKSGTVQMKNLMKEVNIDEIDTIADDLDDSIQEATTMGNALARPFGITDPEEDEAIMKQMAEWDTKEEEDNDIKLPDLPKGKEEISQIKIQTK